MYFNRDRLPITTLLPFHFISLPTLYISLHSLLSFLSSFLPSFFHSLMFLFLSYSPFTLLLIFISSLSLHLFLPFLHFLPLSPFPSMLLFILHFYSFSSTLFFIPQLQFTSCLLIGTRCSLPVSQSIIQAVRLPLILTNDFLEETFVRLSCQRLSDV